MIETKQINQKTDLKISTEEMAEAGVHFGHKTSRVNPKMQPYLFGSRNNIHIIDLDKTKEKLNIAFEFVEKLVSEGKTLLLVGTKIQTKGLVKQTAQDCGLPYISERWLGGTFTNFPIILKRVDYYKELERKKKEGEWEKYTKKEKAKFNKELDRLQIKFEGIRNMTRLPDAIFVCDMQKDNLAVKEAKNKGIKIIAIADTNADPTQIDYPIPANDDAFSSVEYILGKLKEVVINNKPKN